MRGAATSFLQLCKNVDVTDEMRNLIHTVCFHSRFVMGFEQRYRFRTLEDKSILPQSKNYKKNLQLYCGRMFVLLSYWPFLCQSMIRDIDLNLLVNYLSNNKENNIPK